MDFLGKFWEFFCCESVVFFCFFWVFVGSFGIGLGIGYEFFMVSLFGNNVSWVSMVNIFFV